jgi:hypothetical protein
MSVQSFIDVSQKLTWPVVTATGPAATVAVNVTMLPTVTEVTALPPEVTARLTVVRGLVIAEALVQLPFSPATIARHNIIDLAGWVPWANIRWKTTRIRKQ